MKFPFLTSLLSGLSTLKGKKAAGAPVVDLRISTEEPFPEMGPPFLWWLWLTVDEWELLYSLSAMWTEQQEIEVGLSVYDSMKEAGKKLQGDYGYEFEGVEFGTDGLPWPLVEEPVAIENTMWQTMLQRNMWPDYEKRFGVAVEMAKRIPRLAPLELEIRQSYERIKASVERVKKQKPTEEQRQWIRSQIEQQKALEENPEFQQVMQQLRSE